ncbi:MAG: insulinase family protein [Bacteroidales bacterium]|nr:insulinase family protein [Bacteroidales bacterium]
MITYKKYILDNGLTVVTHEAWDTPLATVNVLYNVGARDESPSRTGFAHLFEHLMFGGTERVPDFDAVVSSLGGENNAFTNNDYTNYYITVPLDGLGTCLELEADRMANLSLNAKALSVQQRVVTEEYNQRYMNQPYGDMWLLMRPLCYKVHPYRWPTIGADIRHVSEATLADVQAFHSRFYRPENAILSVAAPMASEQIIRLVAQAWGTKSKGWRAESGERCFAMEREYPAEPEQKEARRMEVEREVPATAVYLAWTMCGHFGEDFRAIDLLSDVLGNGASSRVYSHVVRPGKLVSEADVYISGEAGPGLFVMSAKVLPGVEVDAVIDALREEVRILVAEGVSDSELEKVQNKYESTFVFSQYKAADRAFSLCHYTWLGQTGLVNGEPDAYRRITPDDMQRAIGRLFRSERENVLVIRGEGR